MEIQSATPYQARLHQEKIERLQRLRERGVPDRAVSLSRPQSGLNGYAAATLKQQERQQLIDEHKRRLENETLEERLSRLRDCMIVKYETNGLAPGAKTVDQSIITITDIQNVFCKRANISRVDLLTERKHNAVVHNRQLCMMLCAALTTKSLPEIGRMFHRDHTTALHGIRRMKIVEDEVKKRLPDSATLLQWVNETLAVFHALPHGALKGRGIVKSHD